MVEQERSRGRNTEMGQNEADAHPPKSDRVPFRVLASWALIGLSIAVGLSAAGLWLALRQAPSPGRVEIIIPTPAPIVVHISGAVANEGVYRLPPGSRIADAIDAAGGPGSDADLSRLNLAARAPDGARINVPQLNNAATDDPGSEEAAVDPGDNPDDAPASGDLVDLNTAPLSALTTLPGIGQKRAEAIIAFRESRDSITSVEDLLEIDGFGPATVENIRPFVAQSNTGQSPSDEADMEESSTGAGTTLEQLVDLNVGSLSALMTLPGIGESRAAAIIRHRESSGPIESVDDLLAIDGIGLATVDAIRPFVVQP